MNRNVLIPIDGFENEKIYWLNKLSGELSEVKLVADFPGKECCRTANYKLLFEKEITQHLIRISKNNDLSFFVILLTSFKILLFKYTQQNEIIVASPTYSKSNQKYNRNVVFRDFIYPEMTFKEILLKVKQTVGEGYRNQYFPIRRLIDLLDVGDTLSLFRVIVLLENIHDKESVDEITRDFENDITLSFRRTGEELEANVIYNSSLFKEETVQRLFVSFQHVLIQISGNTDIEVKNIETIPREVTNEILHEFNKTEVEYPEYETIHRLFERQVERTPDHMAVACMEHAASITYRRMNERANQLARVLKERAVDTGCIVGLMMHDSTEMAVAILGVLKAGGAYLPIDPDYPQERKVYIAKDSHLNILLVGSSLSGGITGIHSPLLIIPLTGETLAGFDTANLQRTGSASDIAYVIYTSGTMGRPKGVVVEHKGLVNFTYWRLKFHGFNERDVTLQLFSPCFDGFGSNFYSSLLSGGTLLVVSASRKQDYEYIKKIVEHKGVTNATLVPGMYEALLDLAEGDELESIRFVVLAGERTRENILEKALEKNPNVIHINEYGPTETTVGATANANLNRDDTAVIGKPISNMRVYILDPSLKLVNVGVPGELYISGVGVARGYLNNPELTSEKFINNSFFPGEKMYKTGDLARWCPDGKIEFLGRVDFQVKIRGFRIELEAIEKHLLEYPLIKEAVVIAEAPPWKQGHSSYESSDKFLCAYIVSDMDFVTFEPGLKEFLSGVLPDYMIPSYFVPIEKIPMTTTGKVNRRALPEPEMAAGKEIVVTPPRDEMEETLAGVWSDVLSINRELIGIDNNFFDLGGHSLKATIASAKIHKELHVDIKLSDIFEFRTIRELAGYIKKAALTTYTSIESVEKRDYYFLSSAQKRLYILQQMEPDNTSYNIPIFLTLEKGIDELKLEETFKRLIERHESLRTSFEMFDDEPVQRAHEFVEFKMEYFEAGGDEEVEAIRKNFVRFFDLFQAPLLRVGVIHTPVFGQPSQEGNSKDTRILMVDMHHIITDGVSQDILTRELVRLYEGEELSCLRLQYKDFSEWQNGEEQKKIIESQKSYWMNAFSGEIPVLNLPADYPRPRVQSFEGCTFHLALDETELRVLKDISREAETTLFMSVLSVFYILLSKVSGQEDIIVGTPAAGRQHADLEHIIGMFVNTLALRNNPVGSKTFYEFLHEVKQRTLEVFENQEYQFEDLVENAAVNINRDASRNPLFDVMFAWDKQEDGGHQGEELNLKPFNFSTETSKFDMTLFALEEKNRLSLIVEYCTKLFKEATIERFIGYFKKIITEIFGNPDRKISGVEILFETEKSLILHGFNETEITYPKDRTIQELFEEQVEKTPGKISVVFKDKHITYNELNMKSDQLAGVLRRKGVRPDTIVSMMADRSLEMVIGILGILKAGGAYLPIDPGYPEERKKFMFNDCDSRILLTQKSYLDHGDFARIVLDIESDEAFRGQSPVNLDHSLCSDNLVYVIYTSGTTGKPKGTLTMHYNVTRVVRDTNYIDLNWDDRVLQLSNYAFDGSAFDIYGALLNGAALVMIKQEDILAADILADLIKREKISVFFVTTALFNTLVDIGIESFDGIRKVLFGGERVSMDHAGRALEYLGKDRIIHVYGPTETTVYASYYFIDEIGEDWDTIPIGKPLANTTAYILDRYLKPQPIGVPGEIYIGGDGLARGYLNRPVLTSEKFIANPFGEGELLYKTGDLAIWDTDGCITFLGRIDHQVKIRGFRVEMGEIENHLLSHEKVKEAFVTVLEGRGGSSGGSGEGDRRLCAYIVPSLSTTELDVSALKEFLSGELPVYMIPTYFVPLDKLPLTPNGKVDKKALPIPESVETGKEYSAPRNQLERKLVGFWSKLLDVDGGKIGIDDDFFDLGGHSLKATVLISRIQRELDVNVPLKNIFEMPTIRELAQYIKDAVEEQYVPVYLVEEREYYDLSYAQQRLWVICQFENESTAYNMPEAFLLSGRLNIESLEQALQNLVKRHESVRTVFIRVEGKPKQKIFHEFSFVLEKADLRQLRLPVKNEKVLEITNAYANQTFDLEKGPLFKAKLVRLEDEKNLLIFNMHHTISDGWSLGIMHREIFTLYNAFSKGNKNSLSPVGLQYKDYTLWHNEQVEKGCYEADRQYWLEKLKDRPNGIELPLDHPRRPVQTFNGGNVYFTIKPGVKSKFHRLNREKETTIFMNFFTLFSIFMSKYTGQQDIVFGSPIAGRKHPELRDLIGFLVNTLVLRAYINPEESFTALLEEGRQETLDSYEHQDYPFNLLVEQLGLDRDVSQSPLFNVMVAHINLGKQEDKLLMDGITLEDSSELENFNMSAFDLIFFMEEVEDHINCIFNYNSDLFEAATIERMSVNFLTFLENAVDNPDLPVSQLSVIAEAESRKIICEFNENQQEFPSLTLQELFEHQVEKSPGKTAVVYYKDEITYNDLNKKANRLAHYLRDQYGVGKGKIIGICIDRSIEMVTALLGIIKAGAGYVAIDPTYPEDRVLHMLNDSQADLLIIDKLRPHLFANYKGKMIDIHSGWTDISLKSTENPELINDFSDILYVIYTSGSTGTPNGAMLSQGILSNLIQWQENNTSIDASGPCLQFTSVNFCVSFQEIMITLTSGGEVHLIDDIERRDIDYLMDFLSEHKIELLYLPFSYLNFLFNESSRWGESFKHELKHIITAGEQLKITRGLKEFLECNRHIKLHNHYGSSEMHVVTSYTMDYTEADTRPVPPAGKPIANTRIFILDEHRNPVPIGVWGELCIEGSWEVAGYINNRELTDKKLISHPVLNEGNKHLYCSGDIGRWLPDGNIELRGRKDTQVKVRGFRVELSEIESKILAVEGVNDCVAVVKSDEKGEKYLAAYVVVEEVDVGEIKKQLNNYLPQYMIPKLLVLDKLPLMHNGKVDRDRLPDPETMVKAIYDIKPGTVSSLLRSGDFQPQEWQNISLLDADKSTVEKVIAYFTSLVRDQFLDETVGVSQIDINVLTGKDKERLLSEAGEPGVSSSHDRTLQGFFEEQVSETPRNIAVIEYMECSTLTYEELNKRSNQLAHLLRRKGVQPGTVVGVMIKPGIEMIIGIAAVLKAGGGYLAVDRDLSSDEAIALLKENNVSMVLSSTAAMGKHPFKKFLGFATNGVEPHISCIRQQITDFNGLPIPDRSLVDYEKYGKNIGLAMAKHTITLQATRGCPYNCLYCHKIWPKKHVIRSAENIYQELKLYYDMGVRRFVFVDDIFNLDMENSKKFFEAIIANGLEVQLFFPNGLRSDLLTRDYIDLMVKAGTVSLGLALETASPRLQKLIKKNLNLEKLHENLKYLCSHYPQVIVELFLMHGFPTETEEEARMTLDFLKSLKWIDFPYFHILKIYPHTDMAEMAVQNGVSAEAIARSADLAYHQLPETLPFDKSVTLRFQTEFLNDYFLRKDRLSAKLPYQMRVLTEDEIVQKYNSYLPVDIKTFEDFLDFAGISKEELITLEFLDEEAVSTPGLNDKLMDHFPVNKPGKNALRILLLDLSQFFSGEKDILYDGVEPPLGLMYLLTWLNRQLGNKIAGKIAKSRIDFDNYKQLKALLDEFQADIIGIRTLTYYGDFFHKTVSLIRQWGIDVPIVAGGPYATSDFATILQDPNVDLVVLSEGELTFCELMEKVLENNGELPDDSVLRDIPGLAFIPGTHKDDRYRKEKREILLLDELRDMLSEEPDKNPEPVNELTDLAAVIYGTGSNRQQVRLPVSHKNAIQMLSGLREDFYAGYNSSGGAEFPVMIGSWVFNGSLEQLFAALLQGGTLCVPPGDTRIDDIGLLEYYKERNKESAGTFLHLRLMWKGGHKGMKQLPGEEDYTAPTNQIEEVLVDIWSEVLGIGKDMIGIDSDFFEVGGHSLKATIVVSKIHKKFNVRVPLAEMFKASTIRELVQYITEASKVEYTHVEAAEEKEYYPLSPAQKRLYIAQQFDLKSSGYNLPRIFILEGKPDAKKMNDTFKQMIERHESFRSSFINVNDEPVQKIRDHVEFGIEDYQVEVDVPIEEITRGFIRAFDLSQAPLLRVGLMHMGKEKYILMMDMHHIITDGISMAIFVNEWMAVYCGEELPALKLHYKDYSEWQGRLWKNDSQALESQENFWLKQFEGEISALTLPLDYERPGVFQFEGKQYIFEIGKEETEALRNVIKEEDVTLFMFLLAVFYVLLAKTSGQGDIVVGIPVMGRRHADFQSIIGMFVNSLALRNYPEAKKTFKEFLMELKERALKAFDNQDYQFDELVDRLDIERKPNRNALFDVMFGMQNLGDQTQDVLEISIPGLKLTPYDDESKVSKIDLVFYAYEKVEGIDCLFEYSTKLFKPETIEILKDRYIILLKRILADLDCRIGDLDYRTEVEKELDKVEDVGFDF